MDGGVFFVQRQRAKLEAEARGVASVLIMFTAGVNEELLVLLARFSIES